MDCLQQLQRRGLRRFLKPRLDFLQGIAQQLDMIDQVMQAGDQRLLTLPASGLPLVVTLKSILFSSITDSYQTFGEDDATANACYTYRRLRACRLDAVCGLRKQ
jgi:hypothetical protein